MTIITKGYGSDQMIIAQGYGGTAAPLPFIPSTCRMTYIEAENRELAIA